MWEMKHQNRSLNLLSVLQLVINLPLGAQYVGNLRKELFSVCEGFFRPEFLVLWSFLHRPQVENFLIFDIFPSSFYAYWQLKFKLCVRKYQLKLVKSLKA